MIAWGSTAAVVGVAIAVIVILASSGGSSEPLDAHIKCSVYDSGENVRVEFDGETTNKGREEGCVSQAQEWSSARTGYWKAGTPGLPEEEPAVVCSLHSIAGEPEFAGIVFVEARTESGENFGTGLCATLAHKGWSQAVAPTGGPWVHEWRQAALERTQAEEAETEAQEAQRLEEEKATNAVLACEEQAETELEEADEKIETETEAREESAPESKLYEVQEEGYERQEAAEEQELEAADACEGEAITKPEESEGQPGIVNPESGTEYR